MTIREAKIDDIKQIQIVRNSVTENTLSNPNKEVKFEMAYNEWKAIFLTL